jgi:hypothetical protein
MSRVNSRVGICLASLLEPRTSAKSIDNSTSPPRTSPSSAAVGHIFATVSNPVKHRPQIFGFFSHGVKP